MEAFIYYGMSKYSVSVDVATQKAFDTFIEAARQNASKRSGGYELKAPNMVDIYLGGDGWGLEHYES